MVLILIDLSIAFFKDLYSTTETTKFKLIKRVLITQFLFIYLRTYFTLKKLTNFGWTREDNMPLWGVVHMFS
jgi:hypothetical protein